MKRTAARTCAGRARHKGVEVKAQALGRLKQLLHSFVRRLASVKLGSLLLIAVFAFTLAAAFFPYSEAAGFIRRLGQTLELENLSRVSEIGFQERFESPPFIALIALLALSLCFSLYFRIRAEVGRWQGARLELARSAGGHPPGGPAGTAIATIRQELLRRGYRSHTAGAGGHWKVHAEKGGGGVWGSVLFHVAILLVLAAVVISATASFKASIKLTEGEAFDARVNRFREQHAGRWYTPSAQPLTLRLARVEPDYEVDGASTVASIVEPTLEGKSSRFFPPVPVYISHGLRHAGVTVHQGRETGYAPQVMVDDASGRRVLEGYTQLATMAGEERVTFADYVEIKDKGLRIDMEVLPDAVYRNGAYVSRSAAKKNAVLHVILRERGEPVLDEFVPMTREVTAGGYTVFFGGLRRWSRLDVSCAPGVPVLVAATLAGALGLALRLLRVRRRIVVSLRESDRDGFVAFDVTGSSEKFPRLFEEELDALRAALSKRLAAPDEPANAHPPAPPLAAGAGS